MCSLSFEAGRISHWTFLLFRYHTWVFLMLMWCAHCYHKSLKWHTPIIEQVNYHTFEFLPLKSTRFKMSHSISTHLLIFPFITTDLPKILFSESSFCLNVLATRSWSWLDITLAHLFTTTHRWSIITLTPTPHTHKISHFAIRSTLFIPNNNVPSRKHTPNKTMPTNKGLRKETGRLITNKSSVASLSAAAKRDPAVTIPPPQWNGQTTRQLPLLPHAISNMQVVRQIQRQLGWEQLLLYLPKK